MATLTDTIGRVLSGRYRIEAAIGTGASAHVYLATDISLKRRVAIKMLHPVLAADRAFLRRFRAEAQAAASLTHPNLVAVHDWGEDVDGPYLVLEYLGGGSLRDLLDDSPPLGPAHVASIGAQAAHGLAYAHARGFVHRDVKPANLLFDDDRRRLCVADFGLARALAEAAWTEPVGATLGTARYAAPEQAQGRRVDGRADVYALALVLYEALTGSVPFSSDTTIGTLMARVGAELPAHDAVFPLEEVLRAAAAPEPDDRLSAAELARWLSEAARELPAPGSLPEGRHKAWRPYDDITEMGGASQNSSETEPSVTEYSPDAGTDAMALASAIGVADRPPAPGVAEGRTAVAHPAEAPAEPPIPPLPAHRAPPTNGHGTVHATGDLTEIGAPAPAGATGYGATAKEVVEKSQKRRKWPWVLLLVVILLGGAAAGGLAAAKHYSSPPIPTHKVPNLQNLTAATATSTLASDHFTVRVTGHRNSVLVPVGWILSQSPKTGTKLKQGSVISVVISAGLPAETVPDLSTIMEGGCPAVTATLALGHLGSSCTSATSIGVKAGGVISYEPTTTAIWGTKVHVVISTGLPHVAVPNLAGMSKAEVTSALSKAHLASVFATPQYSDSVPVGEPISWTGEGSTLLYGSTVTVEMSLGHAPVIVPNVANGRYDVPQAEATLRADGFTIAGVYGPTGGSIVYTDPASGLSEPFGSSVTIYVH
jgi:serine/threonine protein kinase/beta-lactam-binding protein with PASTA domain